MLGRHAEARRAFRSRMDALGQRPELSAAEARIFSLPPAGDTHEAAHGGGRGREDAAAEGGRVGGEDGEGTRSAFGGVPPRWPMLGLALAAANGTTRAEIRPGVGVSPVLRQTRDQAPTGGGDGSDDARFRFVQVYAPPNAGSSSLISELLRLFGSVLVAPEWRVCGCVYVCVRVCVRAVRTAGASCGSLCTAGGCTVPLGPPLPLWLRPVNTPPQHPAACLAGSTLCHLGGTCGGAC